MREMAALLGDPHTAYPTIHLTGTNGKGSTSALCSMLLLAMGLSVGTYTSPNLERVNERIAANGQPLSDVDFVEAIDRLRLLDGVLDERPTRFELLTMAAFSAFADLAVDVGVIEVGMGGTWDSTNIIDAAVSIVTNIELDHVEVLGATREEIAMDKSGIFREGGVAIIGETDPTIAALLRTCAAHRGVARVLGLGAEISVDRNELAVGGRVVSIRTPYGSHDDVFLALNGPHQARNAALAVAAVEAFFDRQLPDDVVCQAFELVTMAARLEVLGRSPLVILDGAHNVAGATALAQALAEGFSVAGQTILVTGMLRGRDASNVLSALLLGGAVTVIATEPDTPRAQAAAVVGDAARVLGHEVLVELDIERAIERALKMATEDDLVVVAGSLYVAGAARPALRRMLSA